MMIKLQQLYYKKNFQQTTTWEMKKKTYKSQ